MKNLSHIGRSKEKQQRERTRTLRKSRRLALKRRRQQRNRRSSVADILNLTPNRNNGNNLMQEAAEQLALTAALNDHRQTVVANKRKGHKKKTSGEKKGRRGSTLSDYPLPSDSEVAGWFATDNSNGEEMPSSTATSETEDPNTEDRKFIKPTREGASDGEYVPTDPEEFDYGFSDETDGGFFRNPERYIGNGHAMESKNDTWDMEELDTKEGEDSAEEREMMGGYLTPPHAHRSPKNPGATMQRQLTPNLGENIDNPFSDPIFENTKKCHVRITRKHAQEGKTRGEVDTSDPQVCPATRSGKTVHPVLGGRLIPLIPQGVVAGET